MAIDLPAAVVDPVIAAIESLAGASRASIRIRLATAVTFPDGSLGCPAPGVAYVQVQVDGYRIVAEVGGKLFDYRGTAPGKFRRCLIPGS